MGVCSTCRLDSGDVKSMTEGINQVVEILKGSPYVGILVMVCAGIWSVFAQWLWWEKWI